MKSNKQFEYLSTDGTYKQVYSPDNPPPDKAQSEVLAYFKVVEETYWRTAIVSSSPARISGVGTLDLYKNADYTGGYVTIAVPYFEVNYPGNYNFIDMVRALLGDQSDCYLPVSARDSVTGRVFAAFLEIYDEGGDFGVAICLHYSKY